MDHRKCAVIHDPAIPVRVDGARLCAGRVVNLQSQRGDGKAGKGEESQEVTHRSDATRARAALYYGPMDLSEEPERRVAFFGGSFDPPHNGHLAVARAARAALQLDTVLFAPVAAQPLKPQGAGAAFADRVEMTRLAIQGEPAFSLSLADAPTPTGEPNYTLQTLQRLRADLPAEGALYCLMGADSYFGLRGWRSAAEIPFAASLIVASRPGQDLSGLAAALPAGLQMEAAAGPPQTVNGVALSRAWLVNAAGSRAPFYLLPGLHVEISASALREQLQLRGPAGIGELLPAAVSRYIRARRLYGAAG